MKFNPIYAILFGVVILSLFGFQMVNTAKAARHSGDVALENFQTSHSGLKWEDVTVGDGPEAKPDETVSVHYVGTLYPSGKKFDSSLDRGEPFQFRLGAGQVIKGWDEGVAGMHVGGKRILVIPPELAYGRGGVPPVIPPDSTLKFEVQLLGVQ